MSKMSREKSRRHKKGRAKAAERQEFSAPVSHKHTRTAKLFTGFKRKGLGHD